MKKTPLVRVKEQFKSKEKLVEAVQGLATEALWLDRVNDTKGLARVSNAKLLRLFEVLTEAKKEFGSRDKLVSSILDLDKRAKDAGYKTRLEGYPLPRLLDMQRASARRAKRSQEKADAKATAKPAAAKKKPAAKKAKPREARPS
ncbi:MAG TPA: hypothetical protein VK524_08170 [Polyangiaceae bacterium]|nr:hypothetical protein [Polyangiaceae bacterium]